MEAMPDVNQLPDWLRTLIFLAGFIGAGIAVVVGYFRKGKTPPTEDLVIAGASIADARPIREMLEEMRHLVAAFREVAAAISEMRDIMRAEADEAEIERRAEEKAAARLNWALKQFPGGANEE